MVAIIDVLNFFIEPLQITFKKPTKFKAFIKNNPSIKTVLNIPDKVVDSNQIVHWDKWENKSTYHQPYAIRMWDKQTTYLRPIAELENIVETQLIDSWSCDIRHISGLSASKSDLRRFKTIDEFATTVSADLISELSEQNLEKNLSWEDGKIMEYVCFYSYSWDNYRIHLCNNGGSHHFSAAWYIASRINKEVLIKGRLKIFSLVSDSVFSLLNQFDLYAIDDIYLGEVSDQIHHFGAPHGFFDAPPPFNNKIIIFLPRDNKRSICISKIFEQFDIFNFGLFLAEALNNQDSQKADYNGRIMTYPCIPV